MKIIVNGQEAAIQESESFEYILENSLFTEADAYSLEIHFPLKGCIQNQRIFGIIETPNIPEGTTFECQLVHGDFHKTGILTILSSNEKEVSAQFLEGMSAMNFQHKIENIHLTELALGEYSDERTGYTPYPTRFGPDTGFGRIDVWDEDYGFRSPNGQYYKIVELYLDELIKRVITQIGYQYDITELYQIPYFSHTVVINDSPHSRGWSMEYGIYKYADAMPYWTIKEFFTELGYLFGGRFVIDEQAKTISFRSLKTLYNRSSSVKIEPTSSYEVDVDPDEITKYRGNLNVKFPEEVNEDGLQDCNWLIAKCDDGSHLLNMTLQQMNTHLSNKAYSQLRGHIYRDSVKGLHTTPILNEEIEYKDSQDITHIATQFQFPAINQFARIKRNGDEVELKIIPSLFEYIKDDFISSDDGIEYWSAQRLPKIKTPELNEFDPESMWPLEPFEMLKKGEQEEKDRHPENIFLAIDSLTGSAEFAPANPNSKRFEEIRRIFVIDGESYPYTYAIDEHSYFISFEDHQIVLNNTIPTIDNSRKYVFDFIMDGVPDVTSEFLIRGERYVCAKITANITTSGISQLKKGEFYKVV